MTTSPPRPLRLGMIGGASGAQIGPVHRRAATFDGRYVVAAAVLSSNPERARAEGVALGLPPERSYGTVAEMLAAEAKRPDGIEVVSIVTPNDSHHGYAMTALAAGLDVICDKPLTNSFAEAMALVAEVKRTGRVFCLTHNYSGYPMIRQARAMVAAGEIGVVRSVQLEYLGAGLAAKVEDDPNTPRRWKLEGKGGPSLVLGDVGTHAFHLASYVLGEAPVRLSAELGASFPDRTVHDYSSLRLGWKSGARGTMVAMQSATGQENNMLLRVIGEKASLEWRHREHNQLIVAPLAAPAVTLTRGQSWLSDAAKQATRIPRAGHPEGFHEGFANLYRDAADAILARQAGQKLDPAAIWFPTVLDGARGVRMIEAAVESDRAGGVWVDCAVE